ncbi:MAG: SAM-dependent methyltransferase [Thermodesulfovibrionales bacterium]|nr:SAM-dependent methyltransferase [Thermodesulfovibrionales bacterium]
MHNAEELLKDTIINNGPISFKDFMNLALYAPEVGYYNRDVTTIGRTGDFYTSSSLHKSFSAIIALQTEEMWQLLNYPDSIVFLEFGAGMGYFAKDFLDFLENKPLFDKIDYWIIEINPYLKEQQQNLLRKYIHKIKWFQTISEVAPFVGIVFSNELLDAFAVHLIEIRESIPYEIWIDFKDNSFKEIIIPCVDELYDYLNDFAPHLINKENKINFFRTEINLEIKSWLSSIAERLNTGFIITIDYGYSAYDYYAIERDKGTLLCYYQHRIDENPYEKIGEKDITAHVNFSSLVRWGGQMSIKPCGFTTQGNYIVAMGIDKVIEDLFGDNIDVFELAKIKGLFMPEGFGSSHKVLIQCKGIKDTPKLRGFSLRNSLKTLF